MMIGSKSPRDFALKKLEALLAPATPSDALAARIESWRANSRWAGHHREKHLTGWKQKEGSGAMSGVVLSWGSGHHNGTGYSLS